MTCGNIPSYDRIFLFIESDYFLASVAIPQLGLTVHADAERKHFCSMPIVQKSPDNAGRIP